MAFSEFWFGQSAHFFYCVSKDFFSIRHVQTYFELHPACLTLGYLSGRLLYPTPPIHFEKKTNRLAEKFLNSGLIQVRDFLIPWARLRYVGRCWSDEGSKKHHGKSRVMDTFGPCGGSRNGRRLETRNSPESSHTTWDYLSAVHNTARTSTLELVESRDQGSWGQWGGPYNHLDRLAVWTRPGPSRKDEVTEEQKRNRDKLLQLLREGRSLFYFLFVSCVKRGGVRRKVGGTAKGNTETNTHVMFLGFIWRSLRIPTPTPKRTKPDINSSSHRSYGFSGRCCVWLYPIH